MIKSRCRRVTTQHDQVNRPTSGARLICDMAGRGDRLESL
jgi:hypothetical protein